MKQYNKVYAPDPDVYYEIWNENNGLEESVDIFLAPPNATIVMTIEELQAFWNSASLYGYEKRIEDKTSGEMSCIADDLKTYLKSKGITI